MIQAINHLPIKKLKESNAVTEKDKSYSDTTPTIDGNKKEYGPMLKKVLETIDNVNSWR